MNNSKSNHSRNDPNDQDEIDDILRDEEVKTSKKSNFGQNNTGENLLGGGTASNAGGSRPNSSKVKDVSELKRGSGVSSGLDTAGKMEEELINDD